MSAPCLHFVPSSKDLFDISEDEVEDSILQCGMDVHKMISLLCEGTPKQKAMYITEISEGRPPQTSMSFAMGIPLLFEELLKVIVVYGYIRTFGFIKEKGRHVLKITFKDANTTVWVHFHKVTESEIAVMNKNIIKIWETMLRQDLKIKTM